MLLLEEEGKHLQANWQGEPPMKHLPVGSWEIGIIFHREWESRGCQQGAGLSPKATPKSLKTTGKNLLGRNWVWSGHFTYFTPRNAFSWDTVGLPGGKNSPNQTQNLQHSLRTELALNGAWITWIWDHLGSAQLPALELLSEGGGCINPTPHRSFHEKGSSIKPRGAIKV